MHLSYSSPNLAEIYATWPRPLGCVLAWNITLAAGGPLMAGARIQGNIRTCSVQVKALGVELRVRVGEGGRRRWIVLARGLRFSSGLKKLGLG